MSRIKTEEELLELVSRYQDSLEMSSPEILREWAGYFYEFVITNYLTYLCKALGTFSSDKEEQKIIVSDILVDKLLFTNQPSKTIICHIDVKLNIKSYLFKIIKNEAIDIFNRNKKTKASISLEEVDPNEIEPGHSLTFEDGVYPLAEYELAFPILFDPSEARHYVHLFICNNIIKLHDRDIIEARSNQHERILKWRTQ